MQALLTEAAAWARARGVQDFWPAPFPVERIRPSLLRGETVLLLRGRVAVGTLALSYSDEPYWGPQPPVAGYVHRFAVRRRFAGRQLGEWLLDWAGREARARGRTSLRLDTLSTNAPLVRYYLDRGFRRVRDIVFESPEGPRPLVLLERLLEPGGESARGRPPAAAPKDLRRPRAPRASRGGSARSRS